MGLVGDAASALTALGRRLEHRPRGQWRSDVEHEVSRWRILAADRAAVPALPVNPERVVRELNGRLPANAQVSVDVGSCVYWYARQLVLPPGVPAHLSGTLASMGCSIPYGIAAKLAHPDRPLVALAGDGAMQMAGVAEGAALQMLGSTDQARALGAAVGDFMSGKTKSVRIDITAKDPNGISVPQLMQASDDPTVLASAVDITGSSPN